MTMVDWVSSDIVWKVTHGFLEPLEVNEISLCYASLLKMEPGRINGTDSLVFIVFPTIDSG